MGWKKSTLAAGTEYHDNIQTLVTYEHDNDTWAGPSASFAGDQLPRTIRKLSQERALVVALLGDSISNRAHSLRLGPDGAISAGVSGSFHR